MKKLYALFVMVILTVAGAWAQSTWTFKVNIPDAVELSFNGQTSLIPEGTSTIEIPNYTSVRLKAAEGYAIVSLDPLNGSGWWWEDYSSSYSCYNAGSGNNFTTTIEAINLAETRTAEFTLNIEGDPDYVKVALTGDFTTYLNLYELGGTEAGGVTSYTIKYSPVYEPVLLVTRTSGSYKDVYSVQCGKYNESRQYEYRVPLTPDCEVNVVQPYPTDPVEVVFSGALEAVNGYNYNTAEGKYVEGTIPADGKISVTLDDRINLSLKNDVYKIDAITVNGVEETNIYSSFNFAASENPTKVEIAAHPYAEINVNVNINIAAGIRFTVSYDEYPLVDGLNVVPVKENSPYLGMSLKGGYILESVTTTVDGTTTDVTQYYYSIQAVEGMTIDIVVKEKEFPYQAILWVDNAEKAGGPYSSATVYCNQYSDNFSIKDGYQRVGLSYLPNEVYLSLGYGIESWVYANGVAVEASYGSYSINTAVDNTVIKAFLDGEPEEASVTFDVDPATYVYIIQDLVFVPEEKTVQCFPGTEFQIAGADIEVYLNDTQIEADGEDTKYVVPFPATLEDGMKIYTMVIEDLENTISVKVLSGVENVAVDAAVANDAIYNLQGVKVGQGSLENLPAGLYIRNGKKIVK